MSGKYLYQIVAKVYSDKNIIKWSLQRSNFKLHVLIYKYPSAGIIT